MCKYRLRVTAKEIRGECHVYEVGDTCLIEEDGYTLRLEKGERLCVYALSAMAPFYSALTKELAKDDWMAAEIQILQCPDAGSERGGCGTVYFEIKREKVSGRGEL